MSVIFLAIGLSSPAFAGGGYLPDITVELGRGVVRRPLHLPQRTGHLGL